MHNFEIMFKKIIQKHKTHYNCLMQIMVLPCHISTHQIVSVKINKIFWFQIYKNIFNFKDWVYSEILMPQSGFEPPLNSF